MIEAIGDFFILQVVATERQLMGCRSPRCVSHHLTGCNSSVGSFFVDNVGSFDVALASIWLKVGGCRGSEWTVSMASWRVADLGGDAFVLLSISAKLQEVSTYQVDLTCRAKRH